MPVEVTFFVKGAMLGLAVSAPPGPIGVMCVRETLVRGMWSGLAVGLGAASADLIYAIVAAFGLAAVADVATPATVPLRVVAGTVLAWLAWRAFRTPGTLPQPAEGVTAASVSFLTAFVLLIANPAAIVIFGGVFLGLGLTAAGNTPASAIAVVAGVVAGAVAWWVILSGGVAAGRSRVTPRVMRVVNVASGAALAGFAVVTWWGIW